MLKGLLGNPETFTGEPWNLSQSTGEPVCGWFTHLSHMCRELEAKLGATPPPSPSDWNSPALLTSRIAQLSAEVDKLRRMLQHTETQSGFKVHCKDVIMTS